MIGLMRRKKIWIGVAVILLVTAIPLAVVSLQLQSTHAAGIQVMQEHLLSHKPNDTSVADWPEFRGNIARDGMQSTNTLLNKGNAGSLAPLSGSGFAVTGQAMSSPVVYQGIVYYVANTLTGSGKQTLHVSTIYAVGSASGQVIWSKPFPPCQKATQPEYVDSSPAVTTGQVNGVATTEVFIGWGGHSPNAIGCFYDFNGLTGNLIWAHRLVSPIDSSPAIMSTSQGSIVVVGDNGDSVRAFSVDYTGALGGTGKQLWQYRTANDVPPPTTAQYCQAPGMSCGDAIWSSPAEGIVMVNGKLHHYIYFGVGSGDNRAGRLDALDLDTRVRGVPVLAWAFWDPNPTLDNDFGTQVVVTDTNGFALRVFAGVHTGHIFGLDAVNGNMYFDFDTSAHANGVQSFNHSVGTLVTINGTTELIFGSGCAPSLDYTSCNGGNNGYIWAIDALSTVSNGTLLWQSQNFGADIVSSPAVVNQGTNAVVFIMGPWYPGSTARGDLLAIDPVDGSIIADYQVFNHTYGAVSSPAIYGGRIFVTEGYFLYAKNPPTGGGLAAFGCAGC